MIELSPAVIAVIMFGGLFAGVFSGFPLALVVGTIALTVGVAAFGGPVLDLMYTRIFKLVTDYILLAIPLFIFMGGMLEVSGIARGMYGALYLWLGGFRGGLAFTTILVGTMLAACVGIVGASVTMLGLVAVPPMVARGYSKSLACGSACAAGTLGILIPPSILLIIYGPMANISVGKLFMGAFLPGLLLSSLYCTYIVINCLIRPHIAPTIPATERALPFIQKTKILIISLVPPAALIFVVLGVIYFGIASPTEAAAAGALASILLAIAYRKFNWQALRTVTLQTLRVTAMIMLIGSMSYAFTGVFLGGGGGAVVKGFILSAPGGSWGAFAVIMFIIFLLGFFIDVIGIIFIMVPILSPIVPLLGFDPLWFAIMVNVNLQTAFMTPPFAVSIFYLKGALPAELGITLGDIVRGVVPFVALILIGLALCITFPDIILWLPGMMIK